MLAEAEPGKTTELWQQEENQVFSPEQREEKDNKKKTVEMFLWTLPGGVITALKGFFVFFLLQKIGIRVSEQ